MKLLTFLYQGRKHAGVLSGSEVIPIEEINAKHGTNVPNDLLEIIREGSEIPPDGAISLPLEEIQAQLPYAVPPKIWCIGLNYRSHAEDIQAVQPEEPGSFMKPASCLFPPGGDIRLPPPKFPAMWTQKASWPSSSAGDAAFSLPTRFARLSSDTPPLSI